MLQLVKKFRTRHWSVWQFAFKRRLSWQYAAYTLNRGLFSRFGLSRARGPGVLMLNMSGFRFRNFSVCEHKGGFISQTLQLHARGNLSEPRLIVTRRESARSCVRVDQCVFAVRAVEVPGIYYLLPGVTYQIAAVYHLIPGLLRGRVLAASCGHFPRTAVVYQALEGQY